MNDDISATPNEHDNARKPSPQTFWRNNPMKRYLSLGLMALAFIAASLFTAAPSSAATVTQPEGSSGTLCVGSLGDPDWPRNRPITANVDPYFIYCGNAIYNQLANRDTMGLLVYHTLESLPQHVRDFFTAKNLDVIVFRDSEQRADIFGLPQNLLTVDNRTVPSFSQYDTKTIVVYERRHVKLSPTQYGSYQGVEQQHSSMHESGHMYSFLMGRLSNNATYRGLYALDRARDANYNNDLANTSYNYFLKDYGNPAAVIDKAGYDELFAEQWAIASKIGATNELASTDTFIESTFPCTLAYVTWQYNNNTANDPAANPPASAYPESCSPICNDPNLCGLGPG